MLIPIVAVYMVVCKGAVDWTSLEVAVVVQALPGPI